MNAEIGMMRTSVHKIAWSDFEQQSEAMLARRVNYMDVVDKS